ncbi:MAG: hypothetical protein H6571_23585 [Lewinellaceae bacterium]|nr:hypothetical protein [Lewinellaceae bacterium]
MPKSIGTNTTIVYDANGTKWKKITNGKVHEYVNGIEYIDGELLQIMHAEGCFIPAENAGEDGRVEYWLKDHLGNTRVAIADLNQNGYVDLDNPDTPEDESELIQENHYYPFGMDQLGNWVATVGPKNDYLYNGKEYNEDIGWYDYGARYYDPAIGRWNAIDPLAEEFYSHSPYSYTFNNPVLFIDPTGMAPEQNDWIDNGDGTYTAEDGDSAWSLHLETGISAERANETVQCQYGQNYIGEDGEEKSNIDPGDVVNVFGDEIVERVSNEIDLKNEKAEVKEEFEENQKTISKNNKSIDSLTREIANHRENIIDARKNPEDNGKPNLGLITHELIKIGIESNRKGYLKHKNDSLKRVNVKLKKAIDEK